MYTWSDAPYGGTAVNVGIRQITLLYQYLLLTGLESICIYVMEYIKVDSTQRHQSCQYSVNTRIIHSIRTWLTVHLQLKKKTWNTYSVHSYIWKGIIGIIALGVEISLSTKCLALG